MSHHFDTPTAREDPRINLCDDYLFRGRTGTTVMAMTVNPDAGLSAPDSFREEGLYAFRFDLDDDAREEVTFKVRFGPVSHAENDGRRHVQAFEARRATGQSALRGEEGEPIASGRRAKSSTRPEESRPSPACRRTSSRAMPRRSEPSAPPSSRRGGESWAIG